MVQKIARGCLPKPHLSCDVIKRSNSFVDFILELSDPVSVRDHLGGFGAHPFELALVDRVKAQLLRRLQLHTRLVQFFLVLLNHEAKRQLAPFACKPRRRGLWKVSLDVSS